MKFNAAQGQAIIDDIMYAAGQKIYISGGEVAAILNKYYIPDDGSAPQWLKERMEALRKLPPPTKEKVEQQFRAVEKARRNPGMTSVNGAWSDGTPMYLEIAQVWEDLKNGEPDITIMAFMDNDTVEILNGSAADVRTIHGTDGFIDYLESCCYTLRP